MGTGQSRKRVVELVPQPLTGRRPRGQMLGRIVGWSAEGRPLVDYPGNPNGPISARTLLRIDEAAAARAVASKRDVLLAFEEGPTDAPILVGLLDTSSNDPPRHEFPSGDASDAATPGVDVTFDGRRLILDAQDEIILRCGKASVTLRRNGRVVVRGTHVETDSEGMNRIKGGAVKIN